MPQWIKDTIDEFAIIKGAPRSFAIVTAGVIFAVFMSLQWGYARIIDAKNAQIDSLHDTISSYQGKLNVSTPGQASDRLKELQDRLSKAEIALSRIMSPPRDAQSLYQKNEKVGEVTEPAVDLQSHTIRFKNVYSNRSIKDNIVEFRNLEILFVRADTEGEFSSGMSSQLTYANAFFRIVGEAEAPQTPSPQVGDTRGSVAIGEGACAGPGSVSIGAGAGAGACRPKP